MKFQGLRQYRVLCDLHGQCGGKLFSTRELRADQNLWDLQVPISAAGDIFGRLHVVGMLLRVTTLVVGARSVHFLLKRISIPKVIWVLGPPLLIGLSLLLAATVCSTTGLLPLLEPRMGMKPTSTKRTSPPREHTFLLPANILRKDRTEGDAKENGKAKGKGYLYLRMTRGRRQRKSEASRTSHIRRVSPILAG